MGHGDDLIKSAGHLIGPFEVERVLMEHPAVAEAAVAGAADPIAGEIVQAFIILRPGVSGNEDLRREILAHARRRLGAVAAPKALQFLTDLPRTASGKILRRILREKGA